jgi:hypothetical protein
MADSCASPDSSGKSLNSVILSDFPKILEEFHDKHFSLLWRGSDDGFGAEDFHKRCDGHANTLTVILDTNGNIFGGFTPVKWESLEYKGDYGPPCCRGDESQTSFIFTLTNPHNLPPRKFMLNKRMTRYAIFCDQSLGPIFGGRVSNSGFCRFDMAVTNNSNESRENFTGCFGVTYENDTGLKGEEVLTGSMNFKVKEIEVFEITD